VTDSDEHMQIIDNATRVDLAPYGLPGIEAAEAIDTSGHRRAWLVVSDELGNHDADLGNPWPPHEYLGRLPREIRDRIWDLHCNRRTTSGRPCRSRVAEPGAACMWHQDQQETAP